jgi:hypothetical protein
MTRRVPVATIVIVVVLGSTRGCVVASPVPACHESGGSVTRTFTAPRKSAATCDLTYEGESYADCDAFCSQFGHVETCSYDCWGGHEITCENTDGPTCTYPAEGCRCNPS